MNDQFNGWLFLFILAALIGAFVWADILIFRFFERNSQSKGSLSLKGFISGVIAGVVSTVGWITFHDIIERAGQTDETICSLGGLLFFFLLILSLHAASCIVIFGIGTFDSAQYSGSRTHSQRVSFHCPKCKTEIKPFDLPLRGHGTCRVCGEVFKV
jgi:hypothetical protein